MVARSVVILLAAAACMVGCLHRRLPPQEVAEETAVTGPADTVFLEVENHNWSDVNIFVLLDGRRLRLTNATAAKTTNFAFHRRTFGRLGTFRLLVVRLAGNDRYVTESLVMSGRSTIVLTVESPLSRSSVGVW
jgi:hypothetical protein